MSEGGEKVLVDDDIAEHTLTNVNSSHAFASRGTHLDRNHRICEVVSQALEDMRAILT